MVFFISNEKIPFLRVVERTRAQFGPYYYDPQWNDGYGRGNDYDADPTHDPGLCWSSTAERAWPRGAWSTFEEVADWPLPPGDWMNWSCWGQGGSHWNWRRPAWIPGSWRCGKRPRRAWPG